MSRVIMIQGTMSSAGERASWRRDFAGYLRRTAYRWPPLSPRTWPSILYITEEGLEMGRAQVMQAEAAGSVPRRP